MPGTFDEEDVLIHKRCIIRPKVFHPVILIHKNYLKKSFYLDQPHFGRDEVFFFLNIVRSSNEFWRAKQRNLIFVQNCRVKSPFCLLKLLGATSLKTPQIKPPETIFYKITPLLEPPKLNLTKNKYF